jgi:hypothetical protein
VGCTTDLDEPICIEPGETYEVLFKLQVGKLEFANSFSEDLDSPAKPPSQKSEKDKETNLADSVETLKKYYTLQQVDMFAELHF